MNNFNYTHSSIAQTDRARGLSAIGLRFHPDEKCPSCHSDQTQTLQMAYVQGQTFATPGAIGHPHHVGSFRTQSMLSATVAPPRPVTSNGLAAIVALLGLASLLGFSTTLAGLISGYEKISYVGTVLMVGFAILAIFAGNRLRAQNRKNRIENDYQYAAWLQSWICLRCGQCWDRSSEQAEKGHRL